MNMNATVSRTAVVSASASACRRRRPRDVRAGCKNNKNNIVGWNDGADDNNRNNSNMHVYIGVRALGMTARAIPYGSWYLEEMQAFRHMPLFKALREMKDKFGVDPPPVTVESLADALAYLKYVRMKKLSVDYIPELSASESFQLFGDDDGTMWARVLGDLGAFSPEDDDVMLSLLCELSMCPEAVSTVDNAVALFPAVRDYALRGLKHGRADIRALVRWDPHLLRRIHARIRLQSRFRVVSHRGSGRV